MALSETETQRPCSEARTIEALASALDIAIIAYDRTDRLIAVSPQFLRFFDVPSELLLPGARLRDMLAATYEAGANVLGSLNGGIRSISRKDWIAERIAIHWRERYESIEQLGDRRWVRLCKRRMPDGVLIATIEDVSEQKRRDAELLRIRDQAELSQHILDNFVTPVIVKDSKLRYVIVNDEFCRIPGLLPRQVLGRTAREVVGPELAGGFEAIEGRVLETGVPYETVEDIIRSDGSVMHAITRVRRSGEPGNYYVTISFDDIGVLQDRAKFLPQTTSSYDRTEGGPVAAASEPDTSVPADRVLILDEDHQRAARRVSELKKSGADAVAIANPDEAKAFLDAVQSMKMALSDIEISTGMATALAATSLPDRHARLRQEIERRLATVPPVRPAAVVEEMAKPVATKKSASSSPSPTPSAVTPPVSKPEQSQPAAPQSNRIRVLVAEDNDVNQIVFEQILEGIGVDFRIVSNGQEAVSAWQAAAPDLILMDVSMPVMNGLQAAQAIRDAESAEGDDCAHIPIIAVTAHAMSGDRERCFAAGMDDYLSKPVSPEKLETIIKRWVESSDQLMSAG